MNKRDQIQKDALTVALNNKRCGLGISMGVGKTLIGLKYYDHFRGLDEKVRVLIVAPKLSIFDSWKIDAIKFNINIENIEFTTYLSLNKYDSQAFDIVVLDECHSLLDSHLNFLKHYTGRILGLTGTPPRYADSEKGRMVNQFCPIIFKYITDDAIEDNILNDYKIIVHKMSLSEANNLHIKVKDKEWYTSEIKKYNYWSQRVYNANGAKQKQIASIMRMKALMDFKTKENYAKILLNDIDEKCIIFCNTQDQADRICMYSVHSKNPNADENLQKFKKGSIEKISCVLQLNEGINIPELRAGIIMHAYGNERKSSQRIGRLLRLNPDDVSTVHILCYKNTIDEIWIAEALKEFNQSKIIYFDI